MKRGMLAIIYAAALATACGQTVGLTPAQSKTCSDAVTAQAALKNKAAGCPSLTAGVTTQARCEAQVTQCDEVELGRLESVLTCFGKATTCTVGEESTWYATSYTVCVEQVLGVDGGATVSEACLQALRP
jgi:hypothetical protein